MAERLRKHHQDDVRMKIQASQLVNVLQNHALGLTDSEITPTRLKAIEILLRKSVPDLSAVEMTGPEGGPLAMIGKIELVPLSK
jgi:hypothetical protein